MYHLTHKNKGFFSLDLFKGRVVKNERHGFGMQIFPNGCFFVGFWKNNKANGLGRLVLKDGSFYEGNYDNNKI